MFHLANPSQLVEHPPYQIAESGVNVQRFGGLQVGIPQKADSFGDSLGCREGRWEGFNTSVALAWGSSPRHVRHLEVMNFLGVTDPHWEF